MHRITGVVVVVCVVWVSGGESLHASHHREGEAQGARAAIRRTSLWMCWMARS